MMGNLSNKKATVLIVEDDEALRTILRDKLESTNFATIETNNGRDAIELTKTRRPDLILLDLDMPIMDGMTALKKIRGYPAGQHVPVIILTNLDAADELLVEDMIAQSPSYYLVKSDWKIQDIVTKVKEMVTSE